ncbi:hypothetical protein Tco_1562209 [Tanacetum coccineum]
MYVKGHVDIFDMINIDLFSVIALNMMVLQLGYTGEFEPLFYNYLRPLTSLDEGLYALACEEDVCFLATLVRSFKLIEVYIEHGVTAVDSYQRPPPRVRATIKDITDEPGSIEHSSEKMLLLTWHDSSKPSKEPIFECVTPRSLPQHDSSTPCKDSGCESVTPSCMPHCMLTPPADEFVITYTRGVHGSVIEDVMRQLSFEKTKLDGEAGFGDVAGSGIESYGLNHDESFGVEDLDLNLNELGNGQEDAKHGNGQKDESAPSDEHFFLDVEGINIASENGFDSDPGNDDETSNYRRRRLAELSREMKGVINASGQWKYSYFPSHLALTLTLSFLFNFEFLLLSIEYRYTLSLASFAVVNSKLIEDYIQQGVTVVDSYRRPPPQVRATIEDITNEPGSIEHRSEKMLLLTWHDSSEPTKEPIVECVTPRSFPQHDSNTPCKDSVCESVIPSCMAHCMLTPHTDKFVITYTQLSSVQGVDTQDHVLPTIQSQFSGINLSFVSQQPSPSQVIEDVMRQLSFEETKLDREGGFGDVEGSDIGRTREPVMEEVRTHVPILEEVIVEDYSSEDAGTNDDNAEDDDDFLVDEKNEIVEPDVDVHLFGISMDVSFDNIGVTNLVPDDVLEGEDVDVINVDGFDSDPGNDDETSNYRRRRLAELSREMEGVINASGQWKYSYFPSHLALTLTLSFLFNFEFLLLSMESVDSYRRPPPRVRATIEDITNEPGSIEHRSEKMLLLTWHDSSEPTKELIFECVTPRSLPQHDSSTPCKDSVCESVTPSCMPHCMLTPPTDEFVITYTQLSSVIEDVMRQLSFKETELDGEAGFGDVAGSVIESYGLSHDESFRLRVSEEPDIGRTQEPIMEEGNGQEDAKHGNGQKDESAPSTNDDNAEDDDDFLVDGKNEIVEPDVDMHLFDSFDSDLGNDDETSNYRRRRRNSRLYKNDSVRVRARCNGKVPAFTMSRGNGSTGPNYEMEVGPSGSSGPTTRSKKGRV